MGLQKGQSDEKHVEEAGIGKDIGTGELVTLDIGVPRDAAITELPAKEQSRVLRKVDFRVRWALSREKGWRRW